LGNGCVGLTMREIESLFNIVASVMTMSRINKGNALLMVLDANGAP
jgi:hypothetical protein